MRMPAMNACARATVEEGIQARIPRCTLLGSLSHYPAPSPPASGRVCTHTNGNASHLQYLRRRQCGNVARERAGITGIATAVTCVWTSPDCDSNDSNE